MSAATGLSSVEVALLDAVDLVAADEPGRASVALAASAAAGGLGPRYSWPLMVDMGVPWRRHLPLVELIGNAGTALGDPPAEAQYVEVQLSAVGRLALAAERGETGPVPLALVEGSWHAGGPVPPFDPATVVGTLLAGGTDAGAPVLPGGGEVEGEVGALLAGERVVLRVGCTIVAEGGRLVITEVPFPVPGAELLGSISRRAQDYERGPDGRPTRLVRRRGCPVRDVRDESTSRDGLRIVVDLDEGADLYDAKQWLRDVWPVVVDREARLPAPMPERLATWPRGDGTGLRALADVLTPHPPA